jgi:hypothetical protein
MVLATIGLISAEYTAGCRGKDSNIIDIDFVYGSSFIVIKEGLS